MKVTKMVAEKERPLTMAETEAYAQFEASDRAGHVVFHPQVAPGKPAPDAVAFLKDFTRLAITYVPDRYRVQGDRWSRLEDDGKETPIDDNPLELAWHAAMAVKRRIEQGRDRGAWVVPVAVFVNMEPDDGIREAEAQSGSRVLFGLCDHVEALVSVLGKRDLQYPLTGRDIAEEVTALSRQSEATDPEPPTAYVDLGDVGRQLGIPKVDIRIDTVNIYVTIASPGGDVGVSLTTDPQQ